MNTLKILEIVIQTLENNETSCHFEKKIYIFGVKICRSKRTLYSKITILKSKWYLTFLQGPISFYSGQLGTNDHFDSENSFLQKNDILVGKLKVYNTNDRLYHI